MTDRRIREPAFGYALTVPTVTAAGEPVAFSDDTQEDRHRFHAASADGHEIYIEVIAFPERLDHAVASEDQRRSLAARAAAAATFAEPTRTVVAGVPATVLDVDVVLDGQRKVRRFVHVDVGDRTLRIALDPTSPTNLAVLDGLELLEPAP